jgi:subtilisin family serine protease
MIGSSKKVHTTKGQSKIVISISILLITAVFLAACLYSATSFAAAAGESDDARVEFAGAALEDPAACEVLVKVNSASPSTTASRLCQLGGVDQLVESSDLGGGEAIERLKLKEGASVEKELSAIRSLPGVEYAEPNYQAQADYTPADPEYGKQWGFENAGQNVEGQDGMAGCDIGAPAAWDLEKGTSNPVTVAVIDSGVDLGHPDLVNKLEAGYNWAGISQSRFYHYHSGVLETTAWEFGSNAGTQTLVQSIKGTGEPLSHVGLLLQEKEAPTYSIHVALRSELGGQDLAGFDIQPSELTTEGYREIYRPFSQAVTLVSGLTYFLVFQTCGSDANNFYWLYHNAGTPETDTDKTDPYKEGMEYRWTGAEWQSYPDDDFYFRSNANACPHDDNGHGSHVAGTIGAAEGNGQGIAGLSFGARLMPLKVLNCTGNGTYADIASAIRYATDHGARVINISISGTQPSQTLQDAIDYAHDRGALLVASTGNSQTGAVMYPAGCNHVVGVGATDNKDNVPEWANHNSSVDLSAPGSGIYSTMPSYDVALTSAGYLPGYDYLSGSSAAAPMVSGLASLMLSREPRFGPDKLEQVMEDHAVDLGTPGRDDYYGYGRINAPASLLEAPTFPNIDSLSVTSGIVGDSVKITGSAFGADRGEGYVSFGGVRAVVYGSWSDTEIVCSIPTGASGRLALAVTNLVGSSYGRDFTVFPHIESLSVASASPGGLLTIYGSAFGANRGASYVSFGGVLASVYSYWSDAVINCRVPQGISGQVDVMVVLEEISSNSLPFEVQLPPSSKAWYLAEGCTAAGFETWVLVQNPGENAVDIDMRFQTDTGETQGPKDTLAPKSRRSYKVNNYVSTYDVSTIVNSSGAGVICERAEYGNGRQWGHDSIGVTAPSTTWYLAEGCTAAGFETWVLVQNPGTSSASVDLIYQTGAGEVQGPHLELAPQQRRSVNVAESVRTSDVSTKVISDVAIVVERAMYWGNRRGGSDSIGYTP